MVTIVPFEPKFAEDFKILNEEWISQYFIMEETDYKSLLAPESYIIDKGGAIFMALIDENPVGTCALISHVGKEPIYEYELAKMAVKPTEQGKQIGQILGNAIINHAKYLGAKGVFLESNTILVPAINLYKKLGFVELIDRKSPYERSNIQMGLILEI